MTPALAVESPAVCLEHPDHLPDLHSQTIQVRCDIKAAKRREGGKTGTSSYAGAVQNTARNSIDDARFRPLEHEPRGPAEDA